MHARTVTLINLMTTHKLRAAHVAKLLGKTPQTVRVWRCKSEDKIIPENMLRLLELELAAK